MALLGQFIAEKNPVERVVVVVVGWIRVIIIPLRGPSDQIRYDPQLELRCQIGPSVANIKKTREIALMIQLGRVLDG